MEESNSKVQVNRDNTKEYIVKTYILYLVK